MNIISHYLSFNPDQLLTNNIDELNSVIKSFIKEKSINIKQIAQAELTINIKNAVDLETVQKNFRALLKTLFHSSIPANTILPTSPLGNTQANLTFIQLKDHDFQVEHKEYQKHNYTLCKSISNKIIFSGATYFDIHNDFLRSMQMTYDFMEQLLDHEEMHFGHIINQSIRIGTNYFNQRPDEQSPWTSSEQVMQLYNDPTLVKQDIAPLNLISCNNHGVIGNFMAATKDAFPIHEVIKLNTDQYQSHISFINDWKQAWFNTHINSCTKPDVLKDNITDQCNDAINLTREALNSIALKNNTNYQIDYLKVYLCNQSGFEDIKRIIEQQIPPAHVEYIQTNLRNPESLIELNGIASFEG